MKNAFSVALPLFFFHVAAKKKTYIVQQNAKTIMGRGDFLLFYGSSRYVSSKEGDITGTSK